VDEGLFELGASLPQIATVGDVVRVQFGLTPEIEKCHIVLLAESERAQKEKHLRLDELASLLLFRVGVLACQF